MPRLLPAASPAAVLLAALCPLATGVWAPPVAAGEPPGAFELLARLRGTYAALPAYADQGEVEVIAPDGRPTARLRLTTRAAAGGGFLLRVEKAPFAADGAPWKVLWREGEAGFHYDAELGQVKAVPSLLAELAHGLVEAGQDALLVPALLLGGTDALDDPEGAALDGPLVCAEGARCWVLYLSRLGGAVASRLWVDTGSGLLHRVEVELYPLPAGAPVPGGAPVGAPTVVRVVHRPRLSRTPPEAAELVFTPPPETRSVAQWEGRPEPVATSPGATAGQPEVTFGEVITVNLYTLVVRVLDAAGRPVRDLGPEDFRAVAGRGAARREVHVESVDWFSAGPLVAREPPLERLPGAEPWGEEPGPAWPPPPGRWVLLFVQADFNAVRIRGHLKLQPLLRDLVDGLDPDDRLAVVSFDSHLKLWQEFTSDRERVLDAVWQAIHFTAQPPPLRRSERGPLAASFDFAAAKKAATPERALELAARALVPLAGDKVMIYLGWGLGRYGAGGVSMRPEYGPALEALAAARTAVFVLDITDAGYHSLEFGLREVADDTGGTYAKTAEFPERAVKELVASLSGHYVLTFRHEDLPEGPGALRIELRGKKGTVYVQP